MFGNYHVLFKIFLKIRSLFCESAFLHIKISTTLNRQALGLHARLKAYQVVLITIYVYYSIIPPVASVWLMLTHRNGSNLTIFAAEYAWYVICSGCGLGDLRNRSWKITNFLPSVGCFSFSNEHFIMLRIRIATRPAS